ncbi:MAG: uridine kinase [Actinomycetota bacterium]|nr:uridine kinase [Actinomycetota bacterium]
MKYPIVESIRDLRPTGRETRIVAIDGYGAAGKSQLAERLARKLGEVTIVHTDDFARPNVPGWEWIRMRTQVLEPVLSDRPGRYQRYDWESDQPAEWHDVPVGGTLIVEGVSSLRDELGRYWDYGIWLDLSHDLRLQRGIGRDGEALRSKWVEVWIPEEDEYFSRQRPNEKADLVIDGSETYEI